MFCNNIPPALMNVSSWAFQSAALSDSEDTQSCREDLQTLVLWVYRGSGSDLLCSTGETYRHTLKITAIFRGFLRIILRDTWQKHSCVIHLCSFAIRFCSVPLKHIIRRCWSLFTKFFCLCLSAAPEAFTSHPEDNIWGMFMISFFLNDPIFKKWRNTGSPTPKTQTGISAWSIHITVIPVSILKFTSMSSQRSLVNFYQPQQHSWCCYVHGDTHLEQEFT